MNKLTILLAFMIYLGSVEASGQSKNFDYATHEKKIDSLRKIDYLNKKYKYLDKNLQIHINSLTFNNGVKKYRYYPERIQNYKDSLGVVLMLEFDDWHEMKIARMRICYSWLRLGYHLWLSVDESKNFAAQFNISHPWRMLEFILDKSNNNPEINSFYKQLTNKLYKQGLSRFENLNRKQLLDFAMQNNPQRIADWQKLQAERKKQREAYQKEHGEIDPSKIGVGCGKENCCQKQGKKTSDK